MQRSVSFDRAADYYDRTRRISEEALSATVGVLQRELGGRGGCLEVGVGTGAISLPLAAAGIPLAGVDLSERMLTRLRQKAGNGPVPALVRGDATGLPFRDGVFGGAIARHVLHLVPEWERVVEELLRVVSPGGVVCVSHGWPSHEDLDAIMDRWVQEAGVERPFAGLPPGQLGELDERMATAGARLRRERVHVERIEEPLETFLQALEEGLYSWTWSVDDTTRRRAAVPIRRWAEETFGPLERPVAREVPHDWRIYELPGEGR